MQTLGSFSFIPLFITFSSQVHVEIMEKVARNFKQHFQILLGLFPIAIVYM